MNISLYTIPYEVANEASKINRLFEMGLEELHIRKNGYNKNATKQLLEGIKSDYRSRVVLHNHYSLALKYNLKGIHVSSDFFDGIMGVWNKHKYFNKNISISTTVFNCTNVNQAQKIFDIIYLGPIYSKSNRSNFDSFELSKVVKSAQKPIYALGGITLSNKEKLEVLGFKGIVLQSAIWKAANIYNAFDAFVMANNPVMTVSDRIQRVG